MSSPTSEVELKAVVTDLAAARSNIEAAAATLAFEGRMQDRIYDTSAHSLAAADFVLRLRSYSSPRGAHAHLDWKGPTSHADGFKVRAELTTGISDAAALSSMLERLGYVVVGAIDRDVAQYELPDLSSPGGVVVVRFERYPRMDVLVEVEGAPAGIEYAISLLGIPTAKFSGGRLSDFVRDFEARTGQSAAISDAELQRTS